MHYDKFVHHDAEDDSDSLDEKILNSSIFSECYWERRTSWSKQDILWTSLFESSVGKKVFSRSQSLIYTILTHLVRRLVVFWKIEQIENFVFQAFFYLQFGANCAYLLFRCSPLFYPFFFASYLHISCPISWAASFSIIHYRETNLYSWKFLQLIFYRSLLLQKSIRIYRISSLSVIHPSYS